MDNEVKERLNLSDQTLEPKVKKFFHNHRFLILLFFLILSVGWNIDRVIHFGVQSYRLDSFENKYNKKIESLENEFIISTEKAYIQKLNWLESEVSRINDRIDDFNQKQAELRSRRIRRR